jgi:hypothetical protein
MHRETHRFYLWVQFFYLLSTVGPRDSEPVSGCYSMKEQYRLHSKRKEEPVLSFMRQVTMAAQSAQAMV